VQPDRRRVTGVRDHRDDLPDAGHHAATADTATASSRQLRHHEGQPGRADQCEPVPPGRRIRRFQLEARGRVRHVVPVDPLDRAEVRNLGRADDRYLGGHPTILVRLTM
jgi:hypothetical protein